jgi:thiamine-phosphate pyrophosphorylase
VAQQDRRLRSFAKHQGHILAVEARGRAARVHNARELTRALVRRPRLVLLSPLHETSSHPGWQPLSRMRAASLARLCGRNALALGGMTAKRYARLAHLGFTGWAGISAFRT